MTITLSPPIRILALVGVLAAAALGLFVFMHSRSSSGSGSSATPSLSSQSTQRTSVTTRATTKPTHASKPGKTAAKLALLPGLPPSIAHALRYSNVVVVSLFARGAQGDGTAREAARAGARAVHAGFVPMNVLDEQTARRLGVFAGATSSPAVLVVKRPGTIVNRFTGYTDSAVVAQAAHDARAR